jgi:NuA3 HAT complex component NTO1
VRSQSSVRPLIPENAHFSADKQDFFKNPVNKNEVPDYFDIVLNPMCWSMVEDRLDKHEYWDVKTFKVSARLPTKSLLIVLQDDIDLVINNAILYNQPGTPFYKAALRIRSVSQLALKKLEGLALPPAAIPQQTDRSGEPPSLPVIGDLESPLDILEVLLSGDSVKDGLNLELGNSSPIASLLATELAQYKPPVIAPPSPELPPKVPSKKSKKRDRRAEAERARARKAVAFTRNPDALPVEDGTQQPVDQMVVETTEEGEGKSIDLREPRTRASIAAAVAFEIEAHGGVLPEDDGVKLEPPQPPPTKAEPEAGPSKPPRKRPSMTLPPLSIPRVVDDVDNQGSFQLFNSGWILPAESKRHGRTPIEKASLPPPKKKQKTGMSVPCHLLGCFINPL